MSLKNLSGITLVCHNILENPKDFTLLESLKTSVKNSDRIFLNRHLKKPLLACVFPYLRLVSEDRNCLNEKQKILFVTTLQEIFEKIELDNSVVFFNLYSFLLFELYDHSQHKVLPLSEEQKLTVLAALTSLAKNVSFDLIDEIYSKKNVPKLSQIVYVCNEFIQNEKSREIRSAAVTCLMAFAKVLDTDDENDIVLRNKISEVFMFFLPGIVGALSHVALDRTWSGYKLILISLKAFHRIIALVAQDYKFSEENENLNEIFFLNNSKTSKLKTRWKNKEEIDAYIDSTTKSNEWYKNTDENLSILIQKLFRVTTFNDTEVKLELVSMVLSLCRKCNNTLPVSIGKLIEIVLTLSEDADSRVSKAGESSIVQISNQICLRSCKKVFESLEDNFYNTIESLPRKFNSVDENEKIIAMNLVIGYVKLLGTDRLRQALISNTILDTLVETLLHISEIETSKVSLLEEYDIKDIIPQKSLKTPWINFKHFTDDLVKIKLENFCALFSQNNCFEILSNRLLDTLFYNQQHKKEAVYLLNCHILGLEDNWQNDLLTLNNIIKIYTDETNNDLPISDYNTKECSHEEIQNNVIQICLFTEGIGKIAVSLKTEFRKYLLQCLYLVLRSTGSGHPLVKASGLAALYNITSSCGYSDVTDLVNANFDYFSYQVGRKLKSFGDKEDVLSILSVVLDHCSVDILEPMCQLVEDVLLESHNKFKQKHATIFLKVFKAFIMATRRWFNVSVTIEPIKSKKQKEMEYEEFKVTGANEKIITDFSDDVMGGKSAEECYKEDLEEKADIDEEEDPSQDDAYKKPESPHYIQTTVDILKTSLHFLPSKDRTRKILVLEILSNGVEILKDFEDELLPIVHQIWSPLTPRFKETQDPLVINRSFKLLAVLARLAKDFIRMRTVKEVLPNILELLKNLSKESYLKDKGAAYRYTQSYKLQINILENLGGVVADLDMTEATIYDCMDCVYLYLSDKQPTTLQAAAMNFFKTIYQYDESLLVKKLTDWEAQDSKNQTKNMEKLALMVSRIHDN